MADKVHLSGATYKGVRMDSGSPVTTVEVTFAPGEDLPPGDLYATATSRSDTVTLVPVDMTGSDGVVVVQLDLDPLDFDEYGRRTWAVEMGTFDDSSGETYYVMFSGSVFFTVQVPAVIASTTVQEAGSS
jgi:hypothetical protein